jgi:hypothetical protein
MPRSLSGAVLPLAAVAAIARRCPRVTRVWGTIGARQRIAKANCRAMSVLLGNCNEVYPNRHPQWGESEQWRSCLVLTMRRGY